MKYWGHVTLGRMMWTELDCTISEVDMDCIYLRDPQD